MSETTLPLQAAAPPRFSEDLVAVGLGLVVFLLALGSLAGADRAAGGDRRCDAADRNA